MKPNSTLLTISGWLNIEHFVFEQSIITFCKHDNISLELMHFTQTPKRNSFYTEFELIFETNGFIMNYNGSSFPNEHGKSNVGHSLVSLLWNY